jgi:N6-adenosine-specific RNA methylase IME4
MLAPGTPRITGLPVGFAGELIEKGTFRGLPRAWAKVLYHDAPVHFRTRSDKGQGRSPSQHYSTMTVDEIIELGPQFAELCAPDCAMIFWWPFPHTLKLGDFLAATGFAFSGTAFVWAKDKIGTGFTTRKQCEVCWLARRGAPKRLAADVRELIIAPRQLHSQKPWETYYRIERLFGGPYLELFGRRLRHGWVQWGDELGMIS